MVSLQHPVNALMSVALSELALPSRPGKMMEMYTPQDLARVVGPGTPANYTSTTVRALANGTMLERFRNSLGA